MPITSNRRSFLTGLGAAGLAGFPQPARAEPPPETTTLRLPANPAACTAPLYVAEELLKAEGFAEVKYVPTTMMSAAMLADGEVDLSLEDGFDFLPIVDAGKSLTLLSGVHVGCHELRARETIQGVTDLLGKKVGISALGAADHLLVSAVAAYVGLDPNTEIDWVVNPSVSQVELFTEGKIDAFIGFPPNPDQPCARDAGHVLVNMAKDPPWSNYICCLAAANSDFVSRHPVAAKRALRAVLKATDICHQEPERAARRMAERGFSYDCALTTLHDAQYGVWREYDPADAVRFFTLRLREAGIIKLTPNEVIAKFTDWRFLDELKLELKT